VSSQVVTLKRIQGERSRWGRNTAPGGNALTTADVHALGRGKAA
jgi:hypothetical protein